jgi:sugar lactone lactonase YvrE
MGTRYGLLLLFVFLACNAQAQTTSSYSIDTFAGSGPANVPFGGFAGDGGAARSALLNLPTGVALDRAGDLYFCDWNNRIRKVDVQTGRITTVAGNGIAGFSGDGGPATGAKLGGPGAIATDAAGDIYFADPYNARVRKISAVTGIITTVAGNGTQFDRGDTGLANQVGIGIPSGVAVDAAGNLYVSNGADRVRKVSPDGRITTLAGSGGSKNSGDGGPASQAQLSQPEGLAVDSQGNIYIAARGEHRIRKVSAATGVITTIAGASTGTLAPIMGMTVYQGGFGGDGGPAIHALLNDPEAVAVDAAGDVYISDTLNYRVRRIDAATGIIHTIAGTGVRGFSGDGGVAVSAQITDPSGLSLDPTGRVFFGDIFNQRIRMLTPTQIRHSIFLREPKWHNQLDR